MQTKADGHDDHHEHGDEGIVHIGVNQIANAGIRLGYAKQRFLRRRVHATGTLQLPPQNRADLSSLTGGRVRSIAVVEGSFVRQGMVLATLEHPDIIELQEEFLTARKDAMYLVREYRREQSLFGDSVSTRQALQLAETNAFTAAMRQRSAAEQLMLLGIDSSEVLAGKLATEVPLRAPISGYVRHIDVQMGSFVEPESDLLEIVDNHHLHADLLVFEQDIAAVREGQRVSLTLTSMAGREIEAKVFAVGKTFEEENRAVRVHAEIVDEPESLIPGLYVEASIYTDSLAVETLPEDAIVRYLNRDVIFIYDNASGHSGRKEHSADGTGLSVDDHDLDHDEHGHHDHHAGHDHGEDAASVGGHAPHEMQLQLFEVETGIREDGFVEVRFEQALPEDALIVLNGAYYVLAEMQKGEGGHGHSH